MNFPHPRRSPAFTLVEVMLSVAILALLMVILAQIVSQTSQTWRYTASKAEQFREARNAFDTMTRRISQATLNTYWAYDNPAAPTRYLRQSELRFVAGPTQNGSTPLDSKMNVPRPTHSVFFQAPFGYIVPGTSSSTSVPNYRGLDSLINTWGYYLEVNDDANFRPPFVTSNVAPLRLRYRLMEFMQPSTRMSIYKWTSGKPNSPASNDCDVRSNSAFLGWMRDAFLAPASETNAAVNLSHVLAENVIALCILPKLSPQDAKEHGLESQPGTALAPDYYYYSGDGGEGKNGGRAVLNSIHQLPPVLQVTMIAIDELSAERVGLQKLTDDRFGVLRNDFLTDARNYAQDLLYNRDDPPDLDGPASSDDPLEVRLIKQKLNYRIFSSNIYLRGAKWSKDQVN